MLPSQTRITILLTGKTGQVGSELARLLPSLGDVIAPNRDELDLLNPLDIRHAVRSIQPQLIVNAAAYTSVDAAEADEPTARTINSEAPALLAQEAKNIGAAMVHYSTDYIFDGTKSTPYEESDPPNPKNVYGRTKLAGEEAIRLSGVPHLIFRTAWVYSDQGRNFLLTILRLAAQNEELKIVSDQIGAPTCSWDIASATFRVLADLYKHGSPPPGLSKVSGTYHMTAAGETSWHGFAEAILERAAAASREVSWIGAVTNGRPIIARRVVASTTAEYPTPASRPAYSVLSNELFARTFGFQLPDWRSQMRSLFARRSSFMPQIPFRKCSGL